MGLLTKIFTAIRGGAREIGENIVDGNSVRIFEQEIKDAEQALTLAKRDLTQVVAHEMQTKRLIADLDDKIAKHEGFATQALAQNNESLALSIAEKMAEFQSERNIQHNALQRFSQHAEKLKALVKKTGKGLAELQRQLIMVKTTQNVQKATASITQNYAHGSSKLLNAKESLDRISKRQQEFDDRLEAGTVLADEFGEGDLDTKLQQAGITESQNSAKSILEGIKARQNAS